MKEWWSIPEIAELGVGGLPNEVRALRKHIAGLHWDRDRNRSREVAGTRGRGGVTREYHYTLFPLPVQIELRSRALLEASQEAANEDAEERREVVWGHYERASGKAKEKAAQHQKALMLFEDVAAHRSVSEAVQVVGEQFGLSRRTLYRLRNIVADRPRCDWLAYLVPHKGGGAAKAFIHPDALRYIVSDYTRPDESSFNACYERLEEVTAKNGWGKLPTKSTLLRRVRDEVGPAAMVLGRGGVDKAMRLVPSLERDKTGMRAMQAVNADGHVGDTRVLFPDGTIQRPIVVGFQDVYSSAALSFRVGQTENKDLIRLAAADMVQNYGIPDHAYFDNGRAFMSKLLTGRMKMRFRFKTKDGDPRGIFTALGTRVHAVTPYHGQSKPIERLWRVICDRVARHPACSGAYTGNSTSNKPSNYGTAAVPLDVYERVLATEMERYNKTLGRNTKVAQGRSYAQVFNESCLEPTTIIQRATAHQRRLFLMEADQKVARLPNGEIHIGGNRFWDEELIAWAGRRVVIRFDPQNLHEDLFVYSPDDSEFICRAPCLEAVGFQDIEGARKIAKLRSECRKKWTAALQAAGDLSAAELAAELELLGELSPPMEVPVANVVGADFAPEANVGPRLSSEAATAAFGRGIESAFGNVFDHPGRNKKGDG